MSNPLGRSYTQEEIAALKRVGMLGTHGRIFRDAALYVTGSYWPRYARKKARDWAIVADALEREITRQDAANAAEDDYYTERN
ncbi:hypothetical protein [Dermabacter vaginalis]|uniref:Uncharacterized protein n=1 Tax=Dermabacter vaginalis TaxID=1630135 RepID=A0ABX6A424_9MICO|nr:hypothetical protein [Dermabacter vaginalis]QEU11624.1 hypothetical protein FOB48_04500 [Dermabacter vaginalis]